MAKKKRHSNKKRKQKKYVVKDTTKNHKKVEKNLEKDNNIAKEDSSNSIESKKFKNEMSDVKYSVLIFAVILVFFVTLYFILKNQNISESIYGIIKL